MRIADFLRGRNDVEVIMGRKKGAQKRSRTDEPNTPRSLLLRWILKPSPGASGASCGSVSDGNASKLGCLVPFPRSCCTKEEAEEEEGAGPDEQVIAAEPGGSGAAEAASAGSVAGDRETKHEALSFNLGIGAGLIFLLAKSASECNKISKLRTELETMLKNMKGEVEKKIADNSCEKPKTNCQRSETSNNFLLHHNDAESCSLSYNTMISDGQSNYQTAFENKNYIKVSKMEQELEVELHRLEILNLEDQESVHPHQDKMEVESETSDERLNEAYQEVNNEAKEEGRKHGGGVCPRELERRLRDLLEARQQERIAELENALECAERKLHDKEMEVCWWRDTARLVSKHSDDKIYMQF